ncbi:MAG: hypothetical protein AB7D28_06345 [Candidatus Berkiella sp.]
MPRFFKKLLYVLVAFAILGAGVAFISSQMPVLPMAAKGFFHSIEKKSYETAYFMMATEFKKTATVEQFQNELERSGLSTARNWQAGANELSHETKKGYIRGFVTVEKDGKKQRIPIELRFIYEKHSLLDQGWRIITIDTSDEDDY